MFYLLCFSGREFSLYGCHSCLDWKQLQSCAALCFKIFFSFCQMRYCGGWRAPVIKLSYVKCYLPFFFCLEHNVYYLFVGCGGIILLRPPSGCHQTILKYTHGVSRSRHGNPFGIWQNTLWSGGQSEREEGTSLIPIVNGRRCVALSSAWADLQSNRLKSLTWVTPRKTSGSGAHLEASVFSPTDSQVAPVGAVQRETTEHRDSWPNFLAKSMWHDFWALLWIVEQNHLSFLVLIMSVKTMLN